MKKMKHFTNQINHANELFLYFLITFLFLCNISSQVTEEWVVRHNEPGNGVDYPVAMVVDNSGNVYVTGYEKENPSIFSNCIITTVKYDSSGQEQWSAIYHKWMNNVPTDIGVDGYGNVYVTGYSIYNDSYSYNYLTVKYNADGVEQWWKTFDGYSHGDDFATAMVVDNLGNVYVTGYGFGSGGYPYSIDYNTVKYNSDGVQHMMAVYDSPGNDSDYATDIALDNSGNIYVTGYSENSGTLRDYATVKYNPAGIQQWVTTYDGPVNGYDEPRALITDNLGNIYVTGRSSGSTTYTYYDYATIKYDSAGVQQWVARYNGPGNAADEPTAIALDSSGNVYVTGFSTGSGTDKDITTIKYNSSGYSQWVVFYNGPANNDDSAYDIAVDSSGNVYVTGQSTGSGSEFDYVTIKYNQSGVEQWVNRYNGYYNEDDKAIAIGLDGSENIYITGESLGLRSNYDFTTIKYNGNGEEQWLTRYYGLGGNDVLEALAIDDSGNTYVTGSSYPGSSAPGYCVTIKINGDGEKEWIAKYSGPYNGDSSAKGIALDNTGNVYVTGYSYGIGTFLTYYDYVTIKYDSNGEEEWVARYNGLSNNDDKASAITLDGWGNIYVTGTSFDSLTKKDFTTIKYSADGIEQWISQYKGSGESSDVPTDIEVDSSGNVYVLGTSVVSQNDSDFITIKYNDSGVEQWVARYNGMGNSLDSAKTIKVDSFGNLVVIGSSTCLGTNLDITTIKYDNNGVEQWIAAYNGSRNGADRARDLVLDNSDNIYLTGYTNYISSTYYVDYVTIKYDPNGLEQWISIYNGTGNSNDWPYAIALDKSNNVYVTGKSKGNYYDIATVKYNNDGIQQWVARYDGPSNNDDSAVDLAVDKSNNVYVAGYRSAYISGGDYVVIKYSQNVSVNQKIWMNY